MTPKDKLIAEYNKQVTGLVNILIKCNPGDMSLEALSSKLRLAKGADEEFLIRQSGPYLYKYQSVIIRGADVFLSDPDSIDPKSLSPDDAKVLASLKAEFAQVNTSDNQLLVKIRSTYSRRLPEEKSDIKSRVTKLLEVYIQYLIECKSQQQSR